MPAQLLALDNGPSILLDKPILLLGRHPECDIQIDSRKISRRHCCIAQVSDYLVIRDLGSTNGIRINGLRVLEGRLSAGDELMIGNARYKVTWGAVHVPAAPHKPALPAPAPPLNDDDELLESCDDPVPLGEPAAAHSPRSLPPSPPPPPAAAPEESLLLPDKLKLMPNSGLIPKDAPQSPESSIHPS